MKKKKLLFIVEAMGGGVFTYIVDLANELAKQYELFIAHAVRKQTPVNYKDYFESSIHLIEVKNFTRSINPVKDYKAYKEIKEIANQIRPDLIHLHSSKAGALGRFAFDGNDIPVYYTPHGYSFLMKDYKPIVRAIFKAVELICAKRNCTTISCSYGEHLETLKLTTKACYVDNGINVKALDNIIHSVNIFNHPFTVFTLGRICYQKNPSLFNAIAEAMPDVHFLWIGDGDMREVLKAKNINITGWVNRYEALQLAMNADVFILTSLWEGLPISLLEAMYMKKLCVVSDVIGNHDVIHSSENGFVCNTVQEYTAAIRKHDSSKQIIEKAYKSIINRYNTDIMSEKYIEIYRTGNTT